MAAVRLVEQLSWEDWPASTCSVSAAKGSLFPVLGCIGAKQEQHQCMLRTSIDVKRSAAAA
jgi:hypothetical protein